MYALSTGKVFEVEKTEGGWEASTGVVLPESTEIFASEVEARIVQLESVCAVQITIVKKEMALLEETLEALRHLQLYRKG